MLNYTIKKRYAKFTTFECFLQFTIKLLVQFTGLGRIYLWFFVDIGCRDKKLRCWNIKMKNKSNKLLSLNMRVYT